MTHPQFRKFKIDWDLFKHITAILSDQITAQLYNFCDDLVQNSIINTVTDVFQQDEPSLLQVIENIVTKRSNPTVHRMHFGSLAQTPTESIQAYLVRLKSPALDCEFSCPECRYDLVPINVKDQFIRGLFNTTLQTGILAKAGHLTILEEMVKHVEAFERALRDQSKLNEIENRPCPGCGSTFHGVLGSNDRSSKCPAWGKNCLNCNIPNHLARVCRK